MATRYFGTSGQRRLDIERATAVVEGGDGLLTVAVVCFLLSVLLAQTALGDAVIVRWVAWSAAAVGVTGMALLRLVIAVWLAPRQATGAAVEAMVMQGPDEGLLPFREQPAKQVVLQPLRPEVLTDDLEQPARAAVGAAWRRLWRRSTRPELFDSPTVSLYCLARRFPEPLS